MPTGSRAPDIPLHSQAQSALSCCCGREDCAFLESNSAALEGLEKDLATAARLGQALLHRHETYMAEAEDDRRRFIASIDSLQQEKAEIQTENERIVEENRSLQNQLDGLNTTLAESEDRVRALSETLDKTGAELENLAASAVRVADLEEQLSVMETEQSRLQETLLLVEEDKRCAIQRWRYAERTLRDLRDQVDMIEKEAREEIERHRDMIKRLERRRAVEQELSVAAQRLKGAAAASDFRRNENGNVVSHFVRDILQDNANLQMGVMELREMLESSNQEVQDMRDQILSHWSLATDRPELATLSEELDLKSQDWVSQELHIHHHYHEPKDKGRPTRRRRRNGNYYLRPVSGLKLSSHQRYNSSSSTSTMLSQMPVSIPPTASRRWSSQTTDVSVASSPQSAYRSSIFDRSERHELSQATSPDSSVFPSPARHWKGSHELSPDFEDDRVSIQPVILEEDSSCEVSSSRSNLALTALYRSTSHDDLLSVAGMDIHTPIHRSMQIPSRIVSANVRRYPTPPAISTTTITAGRGPPLSNQSPQSLLASVAANNRSDTWIVLSGSDSTDSAVAALQARKPSIGRRVGGWVKGKWGTVLVADDIGTPTPSSAASQATGKSPESRLSSRPTFRRPGVNQTGPIRGFRPPPRQTQVLVESLDQGLLQKSLNE